MLDFTLLFGLLVFVIAVNRWLKTTADEQNRMNDQRNRKNLMILIPAALILFSACSNNGNKPAVDSTMVDSTPVKYEQYITKEDLDSLKDEMPDSVGKIFSRGEYEGMRLFMLNCNKCHPGGEKGKGPSLIDKNLPDFLIHFQVRNGLGDMPAFSKEELPKEDVKKIILFLRALREDYTDYKTDPNY